MSKAYLHSPSTPTPTASTLARPRLWCSLLTRRSFAEHTGTVSSARQRRRGESGHHVNRAAADVASQQAGGPLDTVLASVLAIRLSRDNPIITAALSSATYCRSNTFRRTSPRTDGVCGGLYRISWWARRSPARGERPHPHAPVATRAFRAGAPLRGRSPLAGDLRAWPRMRRVA